MPKRLARKPSTASLMPAARKRTNAIRISPAVIAQTTTGTSRMRPSVMRFGMLKSAPRLGPRASPSPLEGAHVAMRDQYSRDQAIAQARIPKYRNAQAKRRARHGGDGPHSRRGRRGPRHRRPARGAVPRLDRACGCRRRRSRTPRSLTGERMAKKRVAVLISGRGSNMAALIEAAKERSYPAEIALVVSNRPEAAGLPPRGGAGAPTGGAGAP